VNDHLLIKVQSQITITLFQLNVGYSGGNPSESCLKGTSFKYFVDAQTVSKIKISQSV